MSSVSFTGYTLNVLHHNDAHAHVGNLKRFVTVSRQYFRETKGQHTIVTDGGDSNMDIGIAISKFAMKIRRTAKSFVQTMGNHDLEGGTHWAKVVKKHRHLIRRILTKPKQNFLSANLDFTRQNPMQRFILPSIIVKSKTKEGTIKIGLIGVSPFDFEKLAFITPYNNFIKIKNYDETLKSIEKEALKLKEQGVDCIGLIAHTGKKGEFGEYYDNFAEIDGINFIFGGHDHKEYNYWHKAADGRNVKIVSLGNADGKEILGENLDSFAKIRMVFDDFKNLIPEKSDCKIELTEHYKESNIARRIENRILKPHKKISYTTQTIITDKKIHESQVGSLAGDAMLWYVNRVTKGEPAQIALVNKGTIRNSIFEGPITIGSIKTALPFTASTLIKTTLTKKQLFDTLNWCVESTKLPKVSPGTMQVGGMRYTIGLDDKVKDVYLVKQDGSLGEKLDDQPDDKVYNVIHDVFLMTGVANLKDLKKNPMSPDIEYFPVARQDVLIEYLKTNFKKKPVPMPTKRIFEETPN